MIGLELVRQGSRSRLFAPAQRELPDPAHCSMRKRFGQCYFSEAVEWISAM